MHDAGQQAMQLLLLTWMLLPGCGAVRGPSYVSGVLGRTLSVTCTYNRGEEMKLKFWCRPGLFTTCNKDIVITRKNKPKVRWGRFSIWDNRKQRRFTVTMENLAKKDAGTYYCGVRRGSRWWNKIAAVKVIVYPAPSRPVQPPKTSTVTAPLQLQPPKTSTVTAPSRDYVPGAPTTRSPTTVEPGTDAPQGKPVSSSSSSAVFPVLAGLQVLALAAGTGAVLWVTLRRG